MNSSLYTAKVISSNFILVIFHLFLYSKVITSNFIPAIFVPKMQLWIFILFFYVCEACLHNDCECHQTRIVCVLSDVTYPSFTLIERFYTHEISLTDAQKGLLGSLCKRFTNLKHLVYNGETCPHLTCVTVTCR